MDVTRDLGCHCVYVFIFVVDFVDVVVLRRRIGDGLLCAVDLNNTVFIHISKCKLMLAFV